ncbi:hypothetical protein D4A92_24090 (plasmid) [Rhizobium rosettiformans]|uniref:Uncharacterized protein n=1 Tax=Rhizobium rosettiformans TaxID=1368430 RepID=A0ABX7F4B4_9HYPH|nr:hypothetical protein D4A92_24090 [Rhizobium rosettiformans]
MTFRFFRIVLGTISIIGLLDFVVEGFCIGPRNKRPRYLLQRREMARANRIPSQRKRLAV